MKTPEWFLRKNLWAYLLLPFAVVYYIASKIIYFYRLFWQKASKRPVICIGNILAGGVGKTPIVMEVAKFLNAPVVMRGYKKNNKNLQSGDEAKMLQKAGIDVYVGSRKKNIVLLNKQKSKTPIVMDDGFQNPTIKKDLSIIVFDENIGVGNGFVLPAGPLREPIFAIKRADAVIIIKSVKQKLKHKFYGKPVFYATNKTILPKVKNKIIAFAGIGYPQKFFDSLSPRAEIVKKFPDHYNYKKSDLDKLFSLARKENADLVTTEKDWVRLPSDIQKKIKVAKLETTIEPAFWAWLKGKTNGII
ncbi:MAG TPA: tetraacyldisaccharide 4'-kinase [Alphaproteobacteria bacterium]|nr:tetraacyldisaccharide 4'-kinase [Alphaproteobacteria bacterium]